MRFPVKSCRYTMIYLETPMGSPFRGHDFFLGYIYILCAIKYIYIYTSIIGLRFHVSSLDGPNYCLWIVRVVCVILTCLDGKNPQVFNVRSTRFMVKSTCLDSKVTMLDMLDGKIGMWTFPKMGVTPRSSKSLDSLGHDFVLKQPW